MLATLFGIDNQQKRDVPREGDVFKVIELHGKTFELRYGFYEESDRYAKWAEPMEIYPDFLKNPQFTAEGVPFVTQMQSPCNHFEGFLDENSGCGDCAFYRHGDELLGTCGCLKNKKPPEAKQAAQKE